MWLAERLVPSLISISTVRNEQQQPKSAEEAISYFGSPQFRHQEDFLDMTHRILPDVLATDIRPLLYHDHDETALLDVQRKGICNSQNKIISQLLFESILLVLRPQINFPTKLNAGLRGVQQLLTFALPVISWEQYNAHGGIVKDALTFELMVVFAGVQQLGSRLFNPKLFNAGTAGRRPDMYLNSTIDAYVECVLTKGNNETERKKLDEHISRFCWEKYSYPVKHQGPAYYQVGESHFAILNYQTLGTTPIQPIDQAFQGAIFNERVFTFLMTPKEIFLGNTLIWPTTT